MVEYEAALVDKFLVEYEAALLEQFVWVWGCTDEEVWLRMKMYVWKRDGKNNTEHSMLHFAYQGNPLAHVTRLLQGKEVSRLPTLSL